MHLIKSRKAAITFTDSMTIPLDMRFTEPAAPLFIDVDGDGFDCLFVLSTNQITGSQTSTQSQLTSTTNRKRERDDVALETPRLKKPMKAAQHVAPSQVHARSDNRPPSRPPNSFPPAASGTLPMFSQPPMAESTRRDMPPPPIPAWAPSSPAVKESSSDAEPLFLPCSQLSQAEVEVLRSTGLGIEDMNADEFAAMLEDDGEEVDFSDARTKLHQMGQEQSAPRADSLDLVVEFGATQSSDDMSKVRAERLKRGLSIYIQCQEFQPLFED